MKRNLLILLAVVALAVVVVAAPVSAKKPAPTLSGDMDLTRVLVDPCAVGDFTWAGTVTFPASGDGPSGSYGMAFIKLGTGKPFTDHPSDSVSFFGEIWAIYAEDVSTDSCPSTDDALIWGHDSGVVTFNNLHEVTYRMNGDVAEAYEDFAMWEGRKVHMSGKVEFVPGTGLTAPGVFRLN
jgi:hypothetical protein